MDISSPLFTEVTVEFDVMVNSEGRWFRSFKLCPSQMLFMCLSECNRLQEIQKHKY